MSGLFLDDENFQVLKDTRSFVCRVVNLSSNQLNVIELESSMGDMISKFTHAKVNLENPDITVYLIFTNEENFFGFSEKNEVRKRPKKSKKYPHELDWKLTRVMINLDWIKKRRNIYVIHFVVQAQHYLESESMGINAIGIDFDENMCEISKENLKINNYKSKILKSDFQKLVKISNDFDGIVTDLPYGRSSKASEKPEESFKKDLSQLSLKTKKLPCNV